MAKVKIEKVVSHLDYDLKRALEAAVLQILPSARFDRQALFRAFTKQVGRKCRTWETVPDQFVDKSD